MFRIPLSIAAVALAAPALAQTPPDPATTPAPAAAAAAPAPTKPDVAAGAKVVDAQGADVGTIESVANGVATLSTGSHRAGIPISSFAAGDGKLILALTRAQVDAQGAPIAPAPAAGSAASATTATTAAAATPATAATPVSITVGAAVKDSTGATVGTVKAVNGDLVTVASATASAQLSKKSFAQSGDALVIGLTAAQFEDAAKKAGGAKKG